MTYIYFEVKRRVILTHNPTVKWCSYIKDSSRCKANHWTMKYRSQWPTFILTSNAGSYRLIIPKYDVHTSNSLQDIRQNHWTMKYMSPTFNLRSTVGTYWLIIPKYDVHISNSLQNIRQNHWTVKYRSCWPSLHDPKFNGARLSNVWSTVSISCFYNRIVEKHFKSVLDFDLAWTLGSGVMEWKPTLQGTYDPNLKAFWRAVVEIWTFEKLAYKT